MARISVVDTTIQEAEFKSQNKTIPPYLSLIMLDCSQQVVTEIKIQILLQIHLCGLTVFWQQYLTASEI